MVGTIFDVLMVIAICLISGLISPRLRANPMMFAPPSAVSEPVQNEDHFQNFARFAPDYNWAILKSVDLVQSKEPNGGGYFIGIHAIPAETPVGYPLTLLSKPLINPPRSTSYCSGSSYTVFIEALDLILPKYDISVPRKQMEGMRMQEPDGGRREDHVKMWGWWNADGFGNDFALVQLSGMGKRIEANDAKPGDFVNISWKSGLGHSTVFLGWSHEPNGDPAILVWSSQTSSNGYGDLLAPISSIKSLCFVRLAYPRKIMTFDPLGKVNPNVPGEAPPAF